MGNVRSLNFDKLKIDLGLKLKASDYVENKGCYTFYRNGSIEMVKLLVKLDNLYIYVGNTELSIRVLNWVIILLGITGRFMTHLIINDLGESDDFCVDKMRFLNDYNSFYTGFRLGKFDFELLNGVPYKLGDQVEGKFKFDEETSVDLKEMVSDIISTGNLDIRGDDNDSLEFASNGNNFYYFPYLN